MKKLVVPLALTFGVAAIPQAALAEVSQTLTATAQIEQVLTLNVIDGAIECGAVTVGQAACADTAEVQVVANSNWSLSIADASEDGVENRVTLTNTHLSNEGSFTVELTPSATSGAATAGQSVTITAGAIGAAGDDISVSDEFGSYEGSFVVTLSADLGGI